MYKLLTHFIFWLIGAMALYYVYITSMATSLGIPDRKWGQADYIEGLSISVGAALLLTIISVTIFYLLGQVKKKHFRNNH